MKITKNLINDLDFEVYSAFEDKVEQADIPENVKVEMFNKLHKMVADWKIEIDNMENEIDEEIYEYSAEAIQDEMADRITQDYLERELF